MDKDVQVAGRTIGLAIPLLTTGATVATVATGIAFTPATVVALLLSIPVTIYVRRQERLERIASINAQTTLAAKRMDYELELARLDAERDLMEDYSKLVLELARTNTSAEVKLEKNGSITVILNPHPPALN